MVADPVGCHSDIGIGDVVDFVDDVGGFNEGLTFGPDGMLYVSLFGNDHTIIRLAADGTSQRFKTLPGAHGLATSATELFAAGLNTGELYRVDLATGDHNVIATGLRSPNFVLPTPWDTWLVSDVNSSTRTITEVTPAGDLRIWATGVSTPNGMIFSPALDAIYVANTFERPGVVKLAVSPDGSAGNEIDFFPMADGSTPDGLAMDANGNVYVVLNIAGEIHRITPAGEVTRIAGGLIGGASLAFGRGDFDHCSLYVSNLLGSNIYRVGVGDSALAP